MAKWSTTENLTDTALLADNANQALRYSHLFHYPSPLIWGPQYLSIVMCFIVSIKKRWLFNPVNGIICCYLLWILICAIRGLFAIEIYWDFKNWMNNIPCLILPIFAVIYADPTYTLSFLRKWKFLFAGILACLALGVIARGCGHFILGPAFFLFASFFMLIPNRKWKVLVAILLVVMIIGDPEARSQTVKGILSIGVCIGCYFADKPFPKLLIKILALSFYPLGVILLYLGISGQWNFFDHDDHSFDNIVSYEDGRLVEREKAGDGDTRTFLYEDIIVSAYANDYIWQGRTPSRGNDAPKFYEHMGMERLEPGMRVERNLNEFCHPNIFTWTGLIGVLLYAAIYIQCTILALFRSNNKYVFLLGALTAFNWLFGWIENCNEYNAMNWGWWMINGFCLSPQFRAMSNKEFRIWFASIFTTERLTPFHKLKILEFYVKRKKIENALSQ